MFFPMQDVDDTFVSWTKSPFVEKTGNFGWLLKIITLDSMKINGNLIFFQVSALSKQTSELPWLCYKLSKSTN